MAVTLRPRGRCALGATPASFSGATPGLSIPRCSLHAGGWRSWAVWRRCCRLRGVTSSRGTRQRQGRWVQHWGLCAAVGGVWLELSSPCCVGDWCCGVVLGTLGCGRAPWGPAAACAICPMVAQVTVREPPACGPLWDRERTHGPVLESGAAGAGAESSTALQLWMALCCAQPRAYTAGTAHARLPGGRTTNPGRHRGRRVRAELSPAAILKSEPEAGRRRGRSILGGEAERRGRGRGGQPGVRGSPGVGGL